MLCCLHVLIFDLLCYAAGSAAQYFAYEKTCTSFCIKLALLLHHKFFIIIVKYSDQSVNKSMDMTFIRSCCWNVLFMYVYLANPFYYSSIMLNTFKDLSGIIGLVSNDLSMDDIIWSK